MYLLAELIMSPGGLLAWIGVGLMAGWFSGLVMSGGGFGIVADIALGLFGAVVGGIVASYFMAGDAGFWASLLIAFLGSCTLIAVVRLLLPGRTRRI